MDQSVTPLDNASRGYFPVEDLTRFGDDVLGLFVVRAEAAAAPAIPHQLIVRSGTELISRHQLPDGPAALRQGRALVAGRRAAGATDGLRITVAPTPRRVPGQRGD